MNNRTNSFQHRLTPLQLIAIYDDYMRSQRRGKPRIGRSIDPEVARQRSADYRQRNPGKNAEHVRNHRHGQDELSVWAAFWKAQDGKCYLCGRTLEVDRRLTHLDHDHRCCPKSKSCAKCRRGLACRGCNLIIGAARDDPGLLETIAANLRPVLSEVTARLAV